MKKRVALFVSLLVVASSLSAGESQSRFLRAYVSALCAEKSGDHAKALEVMQPFETAQDPGMRAAARDFPLGQFQHASVQSSWSLVSNNWSTRSWQFVIGKRERQEAVADLRQCFGSTVTDGPQNGQRQLDAGAATTAWFLTHDVAAVPRARDTSPLRR